MAQPGSAYLAPFIAAGLVACFASTSECKDGAGQCESVPAGSGAGGNGAEATVDAGLPFEGGTTTCKAYDNLTVGAYVVQTNYWNETGCPGTQCMTVDDATGAFSVTQGPNCGSTVASYPNVLYGSSFGVVSPGSALPIQVSALASAITSWTFSVGGAPTDRYDVAYDIWFCPDDGCGTSDGFNGGTEMIIWLNYQNTSGWRSDMGSVTLDGYDWEVWKSTQTMGGASWNYLAYLLHPPMVTSVTNFDLLSFIEDAETRGLVQTPWYLDAVQAGSELRTGGLPFTTTSFSVSINGS